MAVRSSSWLSLPSLWRRLVMHVRLSLRLLRDPAVPVVYKLLPAVAVLYLLSPIDGMPDFIPVLGQLDDLGVLLLALESFLTLCPEPILAHNRAAMDHGRPFSPAAASRGSSAASDAPGAVIDAEFRRDDR